MIIKQFEYLMVNMNEALIRQASGGNVVCRVLRNGGEERMDFERRCYRIAIALTRGFASLEEEGII